MIKSIKRFLIEIARYCMGPILRVIGKYKPREGKTPTAKESSKTNSFANKEGQQPKYLTEAHRKNSEAAIKQIAKWDEQPLSLEDALKRQRARDDGRDTRPPKNISGQYLNEVHNKQQEKPLKLPSAMRAGLKAKVADRMKQDPEFRKRVEQMAESKKQQQSEPQYLNEAHRKNSEAAMKYLNSLDPSKIDWKKEVERQKRNARD